MVSLYLQMTKSTWGSGQGYVLESVFGHEPTVTEVRTKGMLRYLFIKNKKILPQETKAQEMVNETQGKAVGTIRVRKWASINDHDANAFHVVALADSKYDSVMLNNWSTMIRNGDKKRRRVGS